MKIQWFSWKDVGHPAAGGAERLGHEWRRRLVADGHTVRHITARYPGAAAFDTIDGVETFRRGRSGAAHYPAALTFQARHARGWADRVIEEVNTVPYFVNTVTRCPRVVLLYFQLAREIWFHQTPLPVALAGYAAETVYTYLQSRRGVRTITISEDSRRDLARFGFSPACVDVVRVGIGNDPLSLYDASAKAAPFTVLLHGSLRPMKRPADAVRAFHAFLTSGGDGHLWVSGGGDASGLRDYVRAHGLEARVTFFGRTTEAEKLDLMRRASVLIATSVKEGWGLIVTEANSMGTPAVVYDVDGLRSAAGRDNWTSAPSGPALAGRLLEAARTFRDRDRYDDWCRRVLEDSRQYTYEASYRDFRTALTR